MTLQVVFLAPVIDGRRDLLEREKQTLELLVTTPISSFAIVIGKLLSALFYVFLLIAASIPLMAVVFVFGGVGPEDIVRGYIVLIVTALGLGSFGLLCSSLVKRTTAATAITHLRRPGHHHRHRVPARVLAGHGVVRCHRQPATRSARHPDPVPARLDQPVLAQADVLCGTESTFGGGWCSVEQASPSTNNGVIINEGGGWPVPMPAPVAIPERGFAPAGGAIAVDDNGNPVANDVVGPSISPSDLAATRSGRRPSRCGSDVGVLHPALHPGSLPDAALATAPGPLPESRRMTIDLPRPRTWPGRLRRPADRVVVPADPRESLPAPLDPALEAIRGELAGHRARLWLRRIVRRAWIALAAIAVLEAALWTLARFVPLEAAPLIAVTIPIVVALILLIVVLRARPSIGETALAVDVEGGLGDRVSSALELAVGYPSSAHPAGRRRQPRRVGRRWTRRPRPIDSSVVSGVTHSPRCAPRRAMFKPRFSRNPPATLAAARR